MGDTAPSCKGIHPSPRRLLLAAGGLVCTGLATLGVFIPGLPTTIFLIAASYLFTRSCPHLEERLIRTRLFRPFLCYVDGSEPIPRRARITALLAMWICVALSVAILAARPDTASWTLTLPPALAVIGTVVICRFRRRPRPHHLVERSAVHVGT